LRGDSLLQAKARWLKKEMDKEKVVQLSEALNITSVVSSLLVQRGFETPEAAKSFLYHEETFHDPFLMEDMEKAVARIKTAINENEKILVYGDYDADGVSSTSVLMMALKELHANVDFYIPNRFTEGYGPNEGAFRNAKEKGYSLIITVDTGISAVNEALVAKELEIDLIITDHHEIPPVVPEAYAIIHPKMEGSLYPFKELAGVGVAFKLAHALLGRLPEHLLEIAVIGTVADLVPLHDENRLIVKEGIARLQHTKNVGLQALLSICGLNGKELSEESIGFSIGPRINAVGRLQSAHPAVDLLLTEDKEEAEGIAEFIDSLNKERQQIVSTITEEAIAEVEMNHYLGDGNVLVLAKEGWNVGVIGIVASRLVDKYSRPTIVLGIDREKGIAKGSARSIPGFDLFANLSDCRDILPHFGGHPMAAGMTLNMNDVDELRQRLNTFASEQLTEEDFIPTMEVDLECTVKNVTLEVIEQMKMLAPYGVGNPKPYVMISDANAEGIRKIGGNGNHLKLTLSENDSSLDTVGFGFGSVYDHLSKDAKVCVLGELSINEWNNIRKPQLMIKDIRVDDWQLFDVRGGKDIQKVIASVEKESLSIIAFQEATNSQLNGYEENVYFVDSVEEATAIQLVNKNVVFLDLPSSAEVIKALFANGYPSRIYTFFTTAETHLFETNPTREHFKWYYGFLTKYSPFHMKQQAAQVLRHKGWSKETLSFMTQVFFELEFVTIDDGVVRLANQAVKRDLLESPTYQEKQEKMKLENELLYSSYQELKEWFEGLK
jgi:single-stranded-DNA-specific exonuclease